MAVYIVCICMIINVSPPSVSLNYSNSPRRLLQFKFYLQTLERFNVLLVEVFSSLFIMSLLQMTSSLVNVENK